MLGGIKMGEILLPPEIIEVEGKVIFLAGPIQGAPMWQDRAIRYIQEFDKIIHIASPRRDYIDTQFVYNAQVDWETYYLNRAARDGTILFWLAKEDEHNCERPYAQTTRFELGEWKVKHERDGINLVVGIDEGFTNKKYIIRRLSQDCPKVPICTTLEETCQKAVDFCIQKQKKILIIQCLR